MFVYEIGQQEDDLSKRVKIDALKLTDEEWVRVSLFCNLLSMSVTHYLCVKCGELSMKVVWRAGMAMV